MTIQFTSVSIRIVLFNIEIKEWQNKLIWTNFDGKLNCSPTTENDRNQGKNENYVI